MLWVSQGDLQQLLSLLNEHHPSTQVFKSTACNSRRPCPQATPGTVAANSF